jgi:hypothetical protein
MRADTHVGLEFNAPLQRPDTLMQLSRSSLSEIRLVQRGRAISTAAIVTQCAVEARNEGFHSGSAALPDLLINLAIRDAIAREESSCIKCFPETTS